MCQLTTALDLAGRVAVAGVHQVLLYDIAPVRADTVQAAAPDARFCPERASRLPINFCVQPSCQCRV